MTEVNGKLMTGQVILLAACLYGLMSKAVHDKYFAMAASGIYAFSAAIGIVMQFTSNSHVQNVEKHAYFIANIVCLDLLMTDLCLVSGVEQSLAYINLVPPIIDIVMKYIVNDSWDLVTQMTHLVGVALMIFFSMKDTKYILATAGVFFLTSLYFEKQEDKNKGYVYLVTGLGLFCLNWSFLGKDIDDFKFG